MSDWCILRTNGRGTLRLARSLSAVGLEAWAPALTVNQRLPRSKRRRERETPLMPTFVFARAQNLEALVALAHRPGHHETFSIFHYMGDIPLIADRDLEPLRLAERRSVPKQRRVTYRPGQTVRVPEGSFGGMSGIVEQSDHRYTLVAFGGAIRVKIATFILQPNVREDGEPHSGTAALAA